MGRLLTSQHSRFPHISSSSKTKPFIMLKYILLLAMLVCALAVVMGQGGAPGNPSPLPMATPRPLLTSHTTALWVDTDVTTPRHCGSTAKVAGVTDFDNEIGSARRASVEFSLFSSFHFF